MPSISASIRTSKTAAAPSRAQRTRYNSDAIGFGAGTLTVNPRAVILAGTQVYNGTTSVAASALLVANRVGNDDIGVAGTGIMAAKDVGSQSVVSLAGLMLNNPNYTLMGGSGAVAVTPATLIYTADAASRAFGAANPAFSGSVTGFIGNDNQATATLGTVIFNTPANAASEAGAYAIDGAGLTAAHGNYTFFQAAGNARALTVTPAAPSAATATGGTPPQNRDPSKLSHAAAVVNLLRLAGALPVPPPPPIFSGLPNPLSLVPTTTISTSVTADSPPSPLLPIATDERRQQTGNNSQKRRKTSEDAGNMVTGALGHAPGELVYLPTSQNDPSQYSDGKLPDYDDRAGLAAILTTIYRAVAHDEAAKIDQFFDPATGADWRGVGWHNPAAHKVVFGAPSVRVGGGVTASAMPVGENLDIGALLSAGPVLLGTSDSSRWLLAIALSAEGIVAIDPLSGARVVIDYDVKTKTMARSEKCSTQVSTAGAPLQTSVTFAAPSSTTPR